MRQRLSFAAVKAPCVMAAVIVYTCAAWAAEDETPGMPPGADRLMTFPTTISMREGMSSFSTHDLVVFQFSRAIDDATQLSATLAAPVTQITAIPSIKHRFFANQRLKLACIVFAGGLISYTDPEQQGIFTAGGGLVADFCLDDGCQKSLTLVAQPGFLYWKPLNPTPTGDPNTGHAFPFYGGAGAKWELREWLDVLVEVSWGAGAFSAADCIVAPCADEAGNARSHLIVGGVVLANYGIRLHGTQFAGELGFVRPLFSHIETLVLDVEEWLHYFPLGFPWLSLTYQWDRDPDSGLLPEEQKRDTFRKNTR